MYNSLFTFNTILTFKKVNQIDPNSLTDTNRHTLMNRKPILLTTNNVTMQEVVKHLQSNWSVGLPVAWSDSASYGGISTT